jgi:CubicO group peptidase (beta-lactamase class C family)
MMKTRILTASLIFICLLVSCSLCEPAQSKSLSADGAKLEAKVDAYVKPYLDMKVFSGAILIARHGKILLSKGYGMANYELDVANTPKTRFHLASVSKTFTAAAIMLLAERGLLSTSDPLTKYIPDYPNGDKITVHHLLVHTSGIPNVNNFPEYNDWSRFAQTPTSLIDKFKNRPLNFQPGARYDYSNSNYNVLAFIIEKVSGKSYGDFLRENIFEPLGMNDTAHDGNANLLIKQVAAGYTPAGFDGFEKTPYLDWTIKTGNGSLYSTVEDLYKWDRALYTEKLLKKGTVDKIFTAHVDNSVGYGWFISRRLNRKCLRMSGRSPGFQCEIQRYVDDDTCVIVLGNNYSGAASFMINDIAAIAFGEPYEGLTIQANLQIDPKSADQYVGRYNGGADFFVPNAYVTIEKREGHFAMRWSLGGLSWLVPMTEGKFFDRNFGGTVRFVKNDKGEISNLIYRSSGTDYRANKALPE